MSMRSVRVMSMLQDLAWRHGGDFVSEDCRDEPTMYEFEVERSIPVLSHPSPAYFYLS